jgi:hypothetical protein
MIAEYREVLRRLWLLNLPEDRPSAGAYDADVADARQRLAEQARLRDELGGDLAGSFERSLVQAGRPI